MRPGYFGKKVLVIALQEILILGFFFNPLVSVMPVIVAAGFILPFIAYTLAFYRPAVAGGWSRIAFILTILFATVVGFFALLFLTFFLLMTFGGHHW